MSSGWNPMPMFRCQKPRAKTKSDKSEAKFRKQLSKKIKETRI
jgi:hypothetical protein